MIVTSTPGISVNSLAAYRAAGPDPITATVSVDGPEGRRWRETTGGSTGVDGRASKYSALIAPNPARFEGSASLE